MANVLTEDSTMLCPHGATTKTSSTSKLTVNGNKVLIDKTADIQQWTITGCPHKKVTPAHPDWQECTKVSSVSNNAAKLTVNGSEVVLESFVGVTNALVKGVDDHPMSAQAGQQKLTAV